MTLLLTSTLLAIGRSVLPCLGSFSERPSQGDNSTVLTKNEGPGMLLSNEVSATPGGRRVSDF